MGRYKVHNEYSLQQLLISAADKRRPYTKLYAQEWEVGKTWPSKLREGRSRVQAPWI